MSSETQVLIVTSAGAPSSAVVPVLAAIEAAGMRVRAIDVGNAGGGGGGVADRVRRALLGENAERRLKKELESAPPDAAVVFDPHAAIALTVARDQVPAIAALAAPVIGVVGELEPAEAWARTDCDRFIAVDDIAAVALADAGVEGERILVVGAIGERAYAEAGAQDRVALRTRFKLGPRTALVEVAGLGAEHTSSLALQLSLLDGHDQIQYLFDAGSDAEVAAVLRRQVPALGLRGKLFGASSPDGPLLWRAADVIVAKPRPELVSRVLLVGGKLVALLDEQSPAATKLAQQLEGRKRATSAKGLLLLASALESAFGGTAQPPTGDGADHVADIVAAVSADKRGVIDERRAAAAHATRDRVGAARAAASAAAAASAMPGELEDLGGGGGFSADSVPDLDAAEIARLKQEVQQRKAEMTKSMVAARDAATRLTEQAKTARERGAEDEAAQLDKKADAERSRMHATLGELATLETELADLERIAKQAESQPRPPPRAQQQSAPSSDEPMPRSRPAPSIDDALSELKKKAGPGGSPPPRSGSATSSSSSASKPSSSSGSKKAPGTVDDELAALKKKMTGPPPPKKKP